MRQPRQLSEGARYHVTARINRKEMLLDSASVRELFLSTVTRAKKKYRFRIWNFSIMGNHIHFLIEPRTGESLSAIMRWILGVFATLYNRKNGLSGHVWGERFHSRILAGFRAFVLAFAYIDANPLNAGIVVRAYEWRQSGIWHDRQGCRDITDEAPDWLRLQFPDHVIGVLP